MPTTRIWLSDCRDISGGGVQHAIESVGSEQVLAQAYAATRRGGATITVGLPAPNRMLSMPAVSLVAEERTLQGLVHGFRGAAVATFPATSRCIGQAACRSSACSRTGCVSRKSMAASTGSHAPKAIRQVVLFD